MCFKPQSVICYTAIGIGYKPIGGTAEGRKQDPHIKSGGRGEGYRGKSQALGGHSQWLGQGRKEADTMTERKPSKHHIHSIRGPGTWEVGRGGRGIRVEIGDFQESSEKHDPGA